MRCCLWWYWTNLLQFVSFGCWVITNYAWITLFPHGWLLLFSLFSFHYISPLALEMSTWLWQRSGGERLHKTPQPINLLINTVFIQWMSQNSLKIIPWRANVIPVREACWFYIAHFNLNVENVSPLNATQVCLVVYQHLHTVGSKIVGTHDKDE